MASNDPRSNYHGPRRRTLAWPRLPAHCRRVSFSALLSLALLVFAASLFAQSGRQKQQQSSKQTSIAGQRPKRVTSSPGATPRPSVSPAARVPIIPSTDGDPPPWQPAPTPTPQPASATTASSPGSTHAGPDGEELDPADVLRINSNLVTVPASVIDHTGRAVTDLKLEDFELRVDGQPKPISDLNYSDTPVRLALLFDNSSSLSAAREFEKQAAVRFFRSVMRPMDQAAIFSISTFPVLEQGLTNNVQTLVRTIERFGKPDGATALFDTIVQAASYLRPYEGRKVIVIVSDGADTISDIDFNTTLQRVQAADCQIYAVQTGHIENANLYDLAAERRLLEFAAQTGGAVYVPKGVGDLEPAFAQISADLAQQYVLSYYPADEPRDGRFHTISLRVTTRPNLRVRARKGYYATKEQRQALLPSSSLRTGDEKRALGELATPVNFNQTDQVSQETSTVAGSVQAGTTGRAAQTETANSADGSPRLRGPSDDPFDTGPAVKTSQRTSPPTSQPTPQSSVNAPPPSTATSTDPATDTTSKPSPKRPVTGGVLNGKALSLPKPIYPEAAVSAGASGVVTVEVTIDEKGRVISARALSGHKLLQSAAVQAAHKARFSPTLLSGEPVKITGLLTYNFIRDPQPK